MRSTSALFAEGPRLLAKRDQDLQAEDGWLERQRGLVDRQVDQATTTVDLGMTKLRSVAALGTNKSEGLRNRIDSHVAAGRSKSASGATSERVLELQAEIRNSQVKTVSSAFKVAAFLGAVVGLVASGGRANGFFVMILVALAFEYVRSTLVPTSKFEHLAGDIGELAAAADHDRALGYRSVDVQSQERVAQVEAAHTAAVQAMLSATQEMLNRWPAIQQQLADLIPTVHEVGEPIRPAMHLFPGYLRLGKLRSANAMFEVEGSHLFPFPAGQSLLLLADNDSTSARSTRFLHDLMAQLMAYSPSGGVEFACLDPVGLGETFSAFTHLTDLTEGRATFDSAVTERDIEELLVATTQHIERVNANYLRGTYADIEAHNAAAGGGAIPYRIVVAAGLPAELSDRAFRALLKIAAAGPRCGVYLLMSWDLRSASHHGVAVGDLSSICAVIQEQPVTAYRTDLTAATAQGMALTGDAVENTSSGWQIVEDRPIEVKVAGALESTTFGRILSRYALTARERAAESVGLDELLARLNRAVAESPERFPHTVGGAVAAEPTTWWGENSTHRIIAPVGRKGATDFRALELGGSRDGSHALIAGRTGSGKSVLLHAVICSLIVSYGPSELRLQLLDMKDGVGFGIYGRAGGLPHLDVLGVHCPPEFALAALRGMEREMHRRNKLMTDATIEYGVAVDDIVQYRTVTGEDLARSVCVIDEFQELFVDERDSEEANRVIGALAKKGRSAGMHLVMATQSLVGVGMRDGTKSQFGLRISLMVNGPRESEEILGSYEAANIRDVGVALVKSAGELEEVKVAFVDKDDDLPRITSECSALAKSLGFSNIPRIFNGREKPRISESSAVRRDLGIVEITGADSASTTFAGLTTSPGSDHPAAEIPPRSGGGLTARRGPEPRSEAWSTRTKRGGLGSRKPRTSP